MELNVISFNILCVDAPGGNTAYSLAARSPRVRAVITSRRPELIGFQEATPAWLEYLNRDYGEEYEIFNVYRSAASPESTPIAWRRDTFTCLDKGNVWFSDTPDTESRGWDELYDCPRIFTWARLKENITGKEFCFINTHFGFGDQCQSKSAGMLADFARRMGCPCVITGDFNMETDSAGYREMRRTFEDVNARTVDDPGATFHGFDPEKWGEHIDYCFVTGDVRPVSFAVLRETVAEDYPSDHHALFAQLAI